MTVTTLATTITVGDLLLNQRDTEVGDLVFENIQGWFSGAGVRYESTARPGADGSFDARTLRAERVVTISGWLYGESRAHAAQLIQQVLAVGADKAPLTITVDDPDYGRLSARARLSAEPLVDWYSRQTARWQLTFTAPDPTLYGPESIHVLQFPVAAPGSGLQYPLAYPLDYGDTGEAASSAFIPNEGTVPLFLRLRIDGAVTTPRVYTDQGSELRFALNVASGSWLDVLTRDRRVLANGDWTAGRRFAVTYLQDWLAVPPGGATVSWDADAYGEDARLWLWSASGAWI